MNAAQVNSNLSIPQDALSALVDGELDGVGLERLLASVKDQPQGVDQVLGSWHAYHLIGDVLRGSEARGSAKHPADFLAGVRERLKTEDAVQTVPSQGARVLVPQGASQRSPAANDAVFRWKLVAGFASLAAVMAVSWNVIGGAPSGAGGQSVAGPQLASSATPSAAVVTALSGPAVMPVTSAAPVPSPTEVVVNTGQGPLIRDARLEELLAEHRQHGGMSALQMPTGFIRGATYDTSGR